MRVLLRRELAGVHGLLVASLSGNAPQQVAGIHVPLLAIGGVAHLVNAAQQRHMQRPVMLHRVTRDQVAAMFHRLPGRVIQLVLPVYCRVFELNLPAFLQRMALGQHITIPIYLLPGTNDDPVHIVLPPVFVPINGPVSLNGLHRCIDRFPRQFAVKGKRGLVQVLAPMRGPVGNRQRPVGERERHTFKTAVSRLDGIDRPVGQHWLL